MKKVSVLISVLFLSVSVVFGAGSVSADHSTSGGVTTQDLPHKHR